MSDEVGTVQFHDANEASAQSEAAALADLISRSEVKLANLKVQNLVYENNRHEQLQIDGSRAAIAQISGSISRIEAQASQMLESIESAIEEQLTVVTAPGMFGIPIPVASTKSITAMGGTYAGLRLTAAQQRKQRTTMQTRLDDLLRVQSLHTAK
jgi:hypothetical protein